MKDKPKLDLQAETKAAMAEIHAENAADPWTLADKEGKTLATPMDNKTIKNAILKRIPEARKIQLVRIGDLGKMQIVVVCEANYLGETACILVEDDASIFMRHKDLLNIVDNMHLELKSRKKLRKTNKLPRNFLRTGDHVDLRKYKQ